MNRKAFIKNCGFACLGGGFVSLLLESCSAAKSVSGTISGSDLIVPAADFEIRKNGQTSYRDHLIVQHPQLQFPVYVSRTDSTQYSAILMRCTHQGAELQVFGDKLQCPAHGSEFDTMGNVQNGPAEEHLRSFPVSISNNQISISLK